MRIQAHNQELAILVADRTAELADANRMLKRLSESDGLTGVANRRRLDNFLEEEWKRAFRQKTPLSLLMIDLDFFKQYNDSYGHQEGDEVLMKVAAKLQDSARRVGDLVARYGGEEFRYRSPGCGVRRGRALRRAGEKTDRRSCHSPQQLPRRQ